MSIISQISGSFLNALSGGGKATTKEKSALDGGAESSSFQAAVSDIRPGLSKAANAFVASLDRLNSAIYAVSNTRNFLSDIDESVKRIADLAEQATDESISQDDRDIISEKFRGEIFELRKLVASADDGSQSALSKGDVEDVLQAAGINIEGTTNLVHTLKQIGGRDGELGSERVTLDNDTVVNPLSQSVDTVADAEIALEAFELLKKQVAQDFKGIDFITEDLRGAALFARAGAMSFDNAVEYSPTVNDPDKVAQMIVQSIRSQTPSGSIRELSALDEELAIELLSSAS